MKSDIPQACEGFTNSAYINATLYVPKETLYTYQNADIWKNFWDIQEYNVEEYESQLTAVNTIPAYKQRSEDAIFNIKGMRIHNKQKGINIIKTSDGKIKKILVR